MIPKNCAVSVAGMLLAVALLAAPVAPLFGQRPSVAESSTASNFRQAPGKGASAGSNPFPKRFPSPSLEGGTQWLNTSGPITLHELRGKVVVLDFWTYCCINCMHILPDLAYLEKKYPNELVVIGVHSGKFNNEKHPENIRNAILRYEIKHPVINDSQMLLWGKFQVNTWPTFAVIDPEGNFCGALTGEGNREKLDAVISRLVTYHRAKGTLDESPVHFDLETVRATDTPLRYPGKLLADEKGQRLFISDSNHNRIVVTNLAGKFLFSIGSGSIGNKDGNFETAQFDHPQGLDLDKNKLYVADTENHSLRLVDLDQKTVKTIAGNGKQSRVFHGGGKPLQVGLASPWDVKKIGDKVYVAMAGFHQIWVLNGTESIRPFAGTGKEDVVNGALKSAAFAQPSGICTDGDSLYVVDSEGSAVRKIGLKGNGQVTTLVGTHDLPKGQSLFEFGDTDGTGSQARLQHPLGIVCDGKRLYVADSYNHRIKEVDIAQTTCTTIISGFGTLPTQAGPAVVPTAVVPTATVSRTPGPSDIPPDLFEPAGLSIAGRKMYIADTNHHRIQVYDLQSKKLTTLELSGVSPPKPAAAHDELPIAKNATKVAAQTVAAGPHVEFDITLSIPEGFKLNPLAPVVYQLHAAKKQTLISSEYLKQRDEVTPTDSQIKIQIPLAGKSGSGEYQLTVSYSYCKEDQTSGVCKLKNAAWTIPLTVAKSGAKSIVLQVSDEGED